MAAKEDHANNKVGAKESNDKVDSNEVFFNAEDSWSKHPINDKHDSKETLGNDSANVEKNLMNNKVDYLPRDAKEILISLASKWENVLDPNALQVIPLKGAMTNEIFQIKWKTTTGETSQKVLVRMYGAGTEVFFDRDDEVRTFEFLSKCGQGPHLLGRFANGRIEEFINARTLSASDLRDPSTSALIAMKMKEFHDLNMPGPKKVYLWDRLRNWLTEARRLCSPEEVELFHLNIIDKDISVLEKELSETHQCIGFCHNDLQYGNIMLDEKTNSLTMIDYEYASHNPVAYDIANHFSEMVANYHTETPHILDFSKYPDLEERRRFVRTYLSSSGKQPNDDEVNQLVDEVEKYTLANNLLWGLWGIISEHINNIDFDYKEYAKQRFQEYWSRKALLLSSNGSSHQNVINEKQAEAALLSTRTESPVKKSLKFRKLKKIFSIGLFKSKH